jgi:hypothetical protein
MLKTFAILLISAGAALADPIDDTGYLISCDDAGCQIASGGFALWTTTESDPAALAALRGLPDLSAVSFSGDISNMTDANADLTLTKAAHIDDIQEGNLQAMQGDWAPVGEETPSFIRIVGLEWQEWAQGEMTASFAMTAGDSCADGIKPGGGTVINLYRLGDDPAADACWLLEGITQQDMQMRDFQGQAGQVMYRRVGP